MVSSQTAEQAIYLCDFFFANTIPFLEIVEEQDKLNAERKLVEILVQKYDGKARHTDLMNSAHMKRREFKETIESLLEREAVTVETYRETRKSGKLYVLDSSILNDWNT